MTGKTKREQQTKKKLITSNQNKEKNKQREPSKMTDSFAHEAILFFLDVLYRYEGPVEIPDLVSHLSDKECTDGIRGAVADSEDGIRKFLLRFPSLFIVKGDDDEWVMMMMNG